MLLRYLSVLSVRIAELLHGTDTYINYIKLHFCNRVS